MPNLKLRKLPDRTPIKYTIALMPELGCKLKDYAALYRQEYGELEAIETLIPYMLDAFLESDRDFIKARKTNASTDRPGSPGRGNKWVTRPGVPGDRV
ncbi:MAG TPA: DUF2274 domain-containing protein [Terriglobia bacterium]|nr:DUF2274 domain-containing protein [Terriglobia bacterium]